MMDTDPEIAANIKTYVDAAKDKILFEQFDDDKI